MLPVNNLSHDNSNILIFTDGSVDVRTGIGYGAFLFAENLDLPTEEMKEKVQLKRFENTSSTRLELETLLWALSVIPAGKSNITVYTDSQNILGLPSRRKRLEQSGYLSKNNRIIRNLDLYQAFYKLTDLYAIQFVKALGHQPGRTKDTVHRMFGLVDKASRKALRKNKSAG